MLSCKEVSQIASKALDASLSWHERTGLWIHLTFCGLCRRYVKDLRTLRALLVKAGTQSDPPLARSERLSKEARERIRRAISRNRSQ